ncbi:2-amino-4-hydroxy-6-hydroxymethyldihydropteridine diphosphokinase [Pendulispora rubella]|uniref:2-amino-4-hydroxy-6-hydroxymethyldihydropteridine pyrophosphokinase n=1 Tax=Pendulispora rubella TaxID=2741070 RepID=A0ABZ2KZC1_9BACT
MSVRVVVGLGSNLGDRLATLRETAGRICAEVAPIVAASWIYETAPVGPPQPHYLNAALLLHWAPDDLPALLAKLQAIEASLGRVRRERWGARTIDLDILWAEDVVLDLPRLTVPHPRVHERAFAILPLLDVAPDAPYARPATVPGEIERFAPGHEWVAL